MYSISLCVALCCSLLFQVALFATEPSGPDDNQRQAAAAGERLDAWQAVDPQAGKRSLHLICWTPADREPPARYEARLSRIMKHIQAFYASEMEKHGFGKRTFQLQQGNADELLIHLVRGHHPASHYGKNSGREIREECREPLKEHGVSIDSETIVIFCNLASWDEDSLRFRHESPYYASGSSRGGTAWQLDSPELDIPNLAKQKPIIHDGEYGRISIGKHNSIFIGGIAHELGHALGLPHNTNRPEKRGAATPLMGSGNRTYANELRGEGRGSVLSYAHALRLASHPQFSGSVKGLALKATSRIDELGITSTGRELTISGIVQANPPAYGVVAYLDPTGGGDYDALAVAATPDDSGRFAIRVNTHFKGKAGQLRIVVLHTNGAVTKSSTAERYEYPFNVERNGEFDLSLLHVQQELAPMTDALLRDDREQASSVAANLKQDQAISISAALLAKPPTQSPADYPAKETTVALTKTKHQSAKVGWIRPTFNRLPTRELLLVSANQIFTTGIYAHAPARHVYQLGKRWQKLSGKVGLANQSRGTVQFQIKGDGKLLWSSRVIKAENLQDFQIDISDVDSLELLTSPTNDGERNDWGLWLDPELHR